MIARMWKTTFNEVDKDKLVEYANEVSLPVLSSWAGNHGVSFFSSGDEWITLTYWQDQASVDGLADDPEYARIVDGILALGLLGGDQVTTVWTYEGGTAIS